jgi:2'-5' RNA ligase
VAKPVSNLRLFVAVHPPPDIAAAMLAALDALQLPAHRRTSVEQVHLTLQFIGDTPAGELEAVMESVRRSASGIRTLSLSSQRLISLPQRGPAKLIAMESDAPSDLLELHRRLAHRLASNVRDRDRERFLPHFTLCRFNSPVRDLNIEQPVSIEPFLVKQIRLMRSVLLPAGAEHREVMRCELEHA